MDEKLDEKEQFAVSNEAQDNKSGFGKGLFVGVMSTLVVIAVLLAVGVSLLRESGVELSAYQPSEIGAHLLGEDLEKKVVEVTNALDAYYYQDIDEEKLATGMVKGLVDGVGDKYTSYFTKEEYDDYMLDTTGIYYGIGALLSQDKETLVITISKVYPGSPAEEAGLEAGDIFLSAEGVSSAGMEVSDFVEYIRGEEGTTVDVTVLRGKEELAFTVTRRRVEVPTIEYTMFDGNIGYIQIVEFDSVTDEQFSDALEDLKKQGMKGLIVDLRDNPGGLVTTVTNILDEILPEGMLVYTEDKNGDRDEYRSDADCLKMPLTVLINENSASASEIFAGAIKDYQYGTLIGTTTYGKGIVQALLPFEDGSALKVTISRYFTPNGNNIHGIGIEPDIELPFEFEGTQEDDYDYSLDNQINKAIEVLNEKIERGE